MKKIVSMLCAAVVCFMMASCDSQPAKDKMKAEVDEFFAQAETRVNAISDADDFMSFFEAFNNEKDEFMQALLKKYSDEDGNPKGMTEDEGKEVMNYIYDRATAYNKVEGAKFAEVIEPVFSRLENAVDVTYSKLMNGEEVSEDDDVEIELAYEELEKYAEYDNVIPELRDRYESVGAKLSEILKDGEDYGDIEEEE